MKQRRSRMLDFSIGVVIGLLFAYAVWAPWLTVVR